MRRFLSLAVVSLLALAAFAVSTTHTLPAPGPGGLVLDDSSMCGEPYSIRWERVPGAMFYDVEYLATPKGDAGLFCKLTNPFDGDACDCNRYEGDDFPAGCFDGAAMTTATSNTLSIAASGWSLHYRVRAVGEGGTKSAWSDVATAGCWID